MRMQLDVDFQLSLFLSIFLKVAAEKDKYYGFYCILLNRVPHRTLFFKNEELIIEAMTFFKHRSFNKIFQLFH
jgi:hypothetical protein